jgi:mRNA-degrading endonuclease toxin of MazEF toxin-antitoxin module
MSKKLTITIDDEVYADPLTTAGKLRLQERLGRLTEGDMAAVERAICVQLAL